MSSKSYTNNSEVSSEGIAEKIEENKKSLLASFDGLDTNSIRSKLTELSQLELQSLAPWDPEFDWSERDDITYKICHSIVEKGAVEDNMNYIALCLLYANSLTDSDTAERTKWLSLANQSYHSY